MGSPLPSEICLSDEILVDERKPIMMTNGISKESDESYEDDCPSKGHQAAFLLSPLSWFILLAKETHWSFVFGVVVVNGISQGFGYGTSSVAIDFYWKDVQKVQPSAAQAYQGIVYSPWTVKPIWGLFTDVLPFAGYRRKPYLIIAGLLGVISMLTLSLHRKLHAVFALLVMTAGSASVAIADVVTDALVAQNSIVKPALASDMQSLCELSSAIGALLGFSISGILIHAMGSQSDLEETIGFISSIGSAGSLLGVLFYQNLLKDFQFRSLLFWGQLLTGFAGMLDLIFVLRLNLKLGIPDYFFVVIDEFVSQMIGRIKWMPILVLSSKLCPSGIEGTFFALLMSIENIGVLSASSGGGLLLHTVKVTRTEFNNLWIAILIRNVIRVLPLPLLFLVPKSDPNANILPPDMLMENEGMIVLKEADVELASLVSHA